MFKCVIQGNWCITCRKRVLCRKGSGHSTRINTHDLCHVVLHSFIIMIGVKPHRVREARKQCSGFWNRQRLNGGRYNDGQLQ